MVLNGMIHCLHQRDQRTSLRYGTGATVVGVALCCCLQGCAGEADQKKASRAASSAPSQTRQMGPVDPHFSSRDMPPWLDLYREKSLVSISSVDRVVMITFETYGDRDEVYLYYERKFGNEENFGSFRNGRDIISFVREGYGVKITLLDPSRNLWSIEYHRQVI